jgi:uncharacterized protein DUF3500
MRKSIGRKEVALPLFLAAVSTIPQAVLQPTAPASALAQDNKIKAGTTTSAAVAAAKAFLATLTDTQRKAVMFAITDTAQRAHWSNFPSGIFQRNGIKRGDMTDAQLTALDKLLAAVLSPEGYQKVVNIVTADEVLKSTSGGGGRRGPGFGKAEYYVSFLGTPSTTTPWIIQYGGHHLGLNITIVGTNSTMTPSHTGAQPATFTLEGKTIRPLGHENDMGFALVNALDANQKAKAILSYRVSNLVLGPGRDDAKIQPEGIKGSELTADQQAKLLDLASEWINILNTEAATQKLAEVKANLADTYFAWSGPTTNGSQVYFRIQGPTVFIEFAHQMNSPDHIHTIYRDFTNQYGSKWITQ